MKKYFSTIQLFTSYWIKSESIVLGFRCTLRFPSFLRFLYCTLLGSRLRRYCECLTRLDDLMLISALFDISLWGLGGDWSPFSEPPSPALLPEKGWPFYRVFQWSRPRIRRSAWVTRNCPDIDCAPFLQMYWIAFGLGTFWKASIAETWGEDKR